MRQGIYAIYDQIAEEIIGIRPGGLNIFKHDAVAMRFFGDVMSNVKELAVRVDDHDLVCLGYLEVSDEDDPQVEQLVPEYRVVLRGKEWRLLNGPSIGERHVAG